jgi:hypothetical protein
MARMSVRVLRVCCPRSVIRTCPHSLFTFETPRPLCSVPKDHLLVRQMGLTKAAAVFDCRRHDRAFEATRDPRHRRWSGASSVAVAHGLDTEEWIVVDRFAGLPRDLWPPRSVPRRTGRRDRSNRKAPQLSDMRATKLSKRVPVSCPVSAAARTSGGVCRPWHERRAVALSRSQRRWQGRRD